MTPRLRSRTRNAGELRLVRLAVLVAWLASGAALFAQSYAVPQIVVTGGGGPISAGSYRLVATVGEAGAGGPLASGPYSIVGGFWAFAGECPTIALSDTVFPAATASTAYAATTLTQTGGAGTTTFAVTVGALPAGLALSSAGVVSGTPTEIGSFTFAVTATDANGCTGSRSYALTVSAAPAPLMSLDKTSLIFGATTKGASFIAQTGTQPVRLTQAGMGSVTWTAVSNQPWLIVSPASGTGSGTLNVSVQFVSGLSGNPTGSIGLTFAGAGNTAGPISVRLNLIDDGASAGPVGSFDTPTDNATGIAGSIAVSGWAVDDVEVTGVRILRSPTDEEGSDLIFIGNAVFVDGARPDVQAAFPLMPRNTRGGWGYLMLTNFLPYIGNGTYKLYAIADDADGHSTLIGSKTITCTNGTSTAPFGAIDTPGQGEVVGGAAYANFGWVLSPGAGRADPPSGGTVNVLVDGGILGQPSGWVARPDLSALFPLSGFSGVGSALGVYGLDTTRLANGVHTIAWIVTDNQGRTSGVGSRYFTVFNGGEGSSEWPQPAASGGGPVVIGRRTTLTVPHAASARIDSAATLAAEVEAAQTDVTGIRGRRGFDLDAPFRTYAFDDGRVTVQAEELDRIELFLGNADTAPDQTYSGYLRVGDDLAPLPVGSTLASPTGAFVWQPGVGFVGAYDFVFVRWVNGQAVSRCAVRVVLNPKGSRGS